MTPDPLQGQSEVRLWLDDIRDPAHHGRIGWTWCRTFEEATALFEGGCVVEASLDHDLTIEQTIGLPDRERTGYDVVCWMEERGLWPRDGVHVHSMNPSGAARMKAALAAIQRRRARQPDSETNEAEARETCARYAHARSLYRRTMHRWP